MFSHIASTGIRRFALTEVPSLVASLFIAEVLYKFHSFTLECLAFLATWAALSWLQANLFSRKQAE